MQSSQLELQTPISKKALPPLGQIRMVNVGIQWCGKWQRYPCCISSRPWASFPKLTLRRSRVKDVHNSRLRLGFQNCYRLPNEYSTTGRQIFPIIRMRERRERLSKLLTTTHECETTSFPVNCDLARSNMTPMGAMQLCHHHDPIRRQNRSAFCEARDLEGSGKRVAIYLLLLLYITSTRSSLQWKFFFKTSCTPSPEKEFDNRDGSFLLELTQLAVADWKEKKKVQSLFRGSWIPELRFDKRSRCLVEWWLLLLSPSHSNILDATRPQTNSGSVCVSLCASQVLFDTVYLPVEGTCASTTTKRQDRKFHWSAKRRAVLVPDWDASMRGAVVNRVWTRHGQWLCNEKAIAVLVRRRSEILERFSKLFSFR